jgi:hypothetical protein
VRSVCLVEDGEPAELLAVDRLLVLFDFAITRLSLE